MQRRFVIRPNTRLVSDTSMRLLLGEICVIISRVSRDQTESSIEKEDKEQRRKADTSGSTSLFGHGRRKEGCFFINGAQQLTAHLIYLNMSMFKARLS